MHVSESSKPQTIQRRVMQGLLPLDGQGLDVGAGGRGVQGRQWWEKLSMDCRPWDMADGDAHLLEGVEDASLDWLYSSHCLEHLKDPDTALTNWLRVVRPGGKLLICVPHRNLYEGRSRLPSRWNSANHLRFYLPYQGDGPDTVGLYEWLGGLAPLLRFEVLNVVTGDWGNTRPGVDAHADGEYQIDALLQKMAIPKTVS